MAYKHGCCIPGECQGEDAIKIAKASEYCTVLFYQSFFQGGAGSYTLDFECDNNPPPRNLSSNGGAILVILFLCIFGFLVLGTTVFSTVPNRSVSYPHFPFSF